MFSLAYTYLLLALDSFKWGPIPVMGSAEFYPNQFRSLVMEEVPMVRLLLNFAFVQITPILLALTKY